MSPLNPLSNSLYILQLKLKENALRSYDTHGDKGYVNSAHFNTDARSGNCCS